MPQLSQLEILRDTVAEYLSGLGAFQGVKVSTRQDGDIANTIKNEIAKIGVSIEVFIKRASPKQNQSWTVIFDPFVLGVAVYEEVLINQDPTTGTGKGAYFLILEALVALKMWTPPGFSNPIFPHPDGPQTGKSPEAPTAFILIQDFTTILQLAARTA